MQDTLGALRNPHGTLLLTLWESGKGRSHTKVTWKRWTELPGTRCSGLKQREGQVCNLPNYFVCLNSSSSHFSELHSGTHVWYLVEQVQEVWNLGFPVVWHQGVYSSPTWAAAGSQTRMKRGTSWICGLFFFFLSPSYSPFHPLFLLHSSDATSLCFPFYNLSPSPSLLSFCALGSPNIHNCQQRKETLPFIKKSQSLLTSTEHVLCIKPSVVLVLFTPATCLRSRYNYYSFGNRDSGTCSQ